MKDKAGTILAAVVLIFAVCCPVEAAGSVMGAMTIWAFSFVPALLPVFVVTPAITCPEAMRLYRAALSKFCQKAFGIPGEASAAAAVGLMAGSPAGTGALAGIKCKKCEICRAVIMASGLSPAFISTIGSMAGGIGGSLAVAQIIAILSTGWLLRYAWSDEDEEVEVPSRTTGFLSGAGMAAVNIAGVLCYMTLFSVVAAIISKFAPGLGQTLLPFLEAASGLAAIASSDLPYSAKVMLLAFAGGLGGLCVMAQNLAKISFMPPARLFLGKLMHATITALCLPPILALPGGGFAPVGNSPWICAAAVIIIFVASECRRKFNFFRLTRDVSAIIID
ncbi:MAG: hypothetical protein Q4D04_01060 [Clostridia bacterium]|nr:hypothetical protein [Clostridia bacterium]